MSNPLTLKELKSLEVGEWVWIVNQDNNKGYYAVITAKCKKVFAVISALTPDLPIHYFYDYGEKWVAYKSKEQAEGKEDEIRKEVVKELAEILMSTIWEDGGEITIKDLHGAIKDIVKAQYGVEVGE